MSIQTSQESVFEKPESNDELDLLPILGALLDQKWKIIGFTGIGTVIALVIALASPPIYQAGALLRVEEKTASLPGLEDLSEAFGSESSTQAEIEILKSRSVIGTAVNELHLTITARPKFFPIFGELAYRRFTVSGETTFASPPLGLNDYAWGGESIEVAHLETANELIGETFVVTAVESGRYKIESESAGVALYGDVGRPLRSSRLTVLIKELKGREGTKFEVQQAGWLDTVQNIRAALSVSEVGRQTGIISIAYRDANADLAQDLVEAIANVYVSQNIRRLSAEAENSLKFITEQIPFLKQELATAEAAFNNYASDNQSIDVTFENEAILSQLVELDTRIQEAELQSVELNRRFTPNHPNIIAAEEQYRRLMSERARFNSRIESLPDTQQKLLSLRRDVEVASEIYQLLLYKAQEMEVARASTVGNVHVIDSAIVDRSDPVEPKKTLLVLTGVLLGFVFGVLYVLARRLLFQGVESADQIENSGLAVFASIPFSDEQKRWDDLINDGKRAHKARSGLNILSIEEPTDLAVEMLRNLRTSLYFNLEEAPNKAVLITGPSPGVGKSFISVNLATVCALAGQKVVLIDADMRRGYLHRYTTKINKDGLSDYLSGQSGLKDVIFNTQIEGLDIITRGRTPPNPSELLHHNRLQELIDTCSETYDLILFDTPPVLAVTDAKIIGQSTGNALLVCRFDKTTLREIQHAQAQLIRDGAKVTGAVLNGVEKRLSNYYGYGGYYGYGYGYKYASRNE